MHDKTYVEELEVSNIKNGYRDLVAIIDLSSFRRIPWENNIPFFLCSFLDPLSKQPICACPRSLLKCIVENLQSIGFEAFAGLEYEFCNYKETSESVLEKDGRNLKPLTPGMFGYSLQRTTANSEFFHEIFSSSNTLRCPIEGWHTETGPGIYEAALQYTNAAEMADRAALFKFMCKSIGPKYNILTSFMAKSKQGFPGNSGHLHVSLVNLKNGMNTFAQEANNEALFEDLKYLSVSGQQFLAGVLDGLPDIMPILAPNINSYKRLVENFWAPVTVSWGLEHRAASIRLISPPGCSPKATRLEIRVPGSDSHPHLVVAAILGLGHRGIKKKLNVNTPPLAKDGELLGSIRLAKSLEEANRRFMADDSIAREVLGDAFVNHFGGTRNHELRLWQEAVTNWETMRYIELV